MSYLNIGEGCEIKILTHFHELIWYWSVKLLTVNIWLNTNMLLFAHIQQDTFSNLINWEDYHEYLYKNSFKNVYICMNISIYIKNACG